MSVALPFAEETSVALDDENLYLCYEKDFDYMTGIGETGLQAVDLSTEEITSADLPGTGFYDMIKTNIGLQVISDRLSFIYDEELNCVSTISGYQDAVCAFAYEDGSVILDKTGKLILDSLYPNPERSFELYGHEDTPFISHAVFAGDTLYVKYPDSMRIVAYTREPAACEPMEDMGKAVPFDSMAEWDIASESLKKLEKTVGKKLNSASLSGDGKYVAVDNSDGTICIFDVNGVPVKEIRNSGIFILHRNFPYLKEADVYVLENCVFDQDFNLISHLPDGEIAGIGKDQKSLVLLSRYSPDVYYKVPILPYDEILEEADSVLSSYVPDRSILEKYSIE